jgi:hypothetical protein
MIFCLLYGKLPEGDTDEMKQIIFFLRALFVCKSISKFITDGPEITDENFLMECFRP